MHELLDFVNLDEALPLLVLILLLWFIGGQMTWKESAAQVWAWRCAAVVLLLYAVAGMLAWTPTSPADFLVLVLRAMLAAGLASGVAMILLSPLQFLYRELSRRLAVKPEPRAASSGDSLREDEPALEPEPPLPSPTPEERAAAALERYEAKLQLLDQARLDETELRAAREHAKQQYMRELDELLQ